MLDFLQILFSQAILQRTIVDLPAFLEDKIAVCDHTAHDPNKYGRRIRCIFYEAAQNSEVF